MDYRKLIEEICNEENIDYKLISEDWVMALTKNNITKCIHGYKFPLNDHALGNIMDDKFAFYDLCQIKNSPIIEHKILFNPTSKYGSDSINKALEYFNLYNNDVVLKPNNGMEGIDIFHVKDKDQLLNALNFLFEKYFSISICPFYHIEKEYRIVVLNNEVRLIFEKSKPVVIGNGIKTIKELLQDINPQYFNDISNEYDRVLAKDEVYEYDWRFNLSRGATAKLVEDKELYNLLSEKAIHVCKSIGAKFISVDIIRCNNEYLLMEVNSGVCIKTVCNFIDRNIAKEIYRDAIKLMFEE